MRRPPLVVTLTAALALMLSGVLLGTTPSPATAADATQSEAWRPQAHYTPAANWMNDPNGLVYENGTYHLFYQHNPYGLPWGNMSWGHATSPDLVHWTEQAVAIPATDAYGVFSGSAVYDERNTSGLGTADAPPLVALWTRADTATSIQAQALSYSTDHGKTWTNLNNATPVLDIGSKEFRDPKVFWDSVANRWTLAAVVATERKVRFYSSPNLIDWTFESEFGGVGDTTAVWECPDLFPLAVDGDPARTKWVLSLSVAGQVGQTKYFVGDWNGSTFTADPLPSYDGSEGTVLAGFDSGTWDGWTVTGNAFGSAPATGASPGQLPLTGQQGAGLVNTFYDSATGQGSDAATGSATSAPFTISAPYLNMLVGGGKHPYDAAATGDDGGGTLLASFDSGTWEGWTVTGNAFGSAPSTGANPPQQALINQRGAGLLNSFYDSATGQGTDATTGTATSPAFTIDADHINLHIGGGSATAASGAGQTTVDLVVDGAVVRSASGKDLEELNWQSWDVADLKGRQATLVVTDTATGGWGHILLDEVRMSDRVATPAASNTSVNVVVDGAVVASATGSQSESLDWTSLDLRPWMGKQATLVIEDNNATSEYGHILVDSITASSTAGFSQRDVMPILDHGRDNYAAVTWNGAPDGKRYAIGWMSNWSYVNGVPTSTWRTAMTLPREYQLRTVGGRLRVVSTPVEALSSLRAGQPVTASDMSVDGSADLASAAGTSYDLSVALEPGSSTRSGLKVLVGDGEETVIGYDAQAGQLYVDRTRSGEVGFSPSFPSVSRAPVSLGADGLLHLRVVVDRSSVEVFANDGEAVITSAVYPSPGATGVSLFSEGGAAVARTLSSQSLADYRGPAPSPDPTPAPDPSASGWVWTGSAWTYVDPATGQAVTGWLKDAGSWYYLDPATGAMSTGWARVGTLWYYLRPDGAMATGWTAVGGHWYFLEPAWGHMITGWIATGGHWYYLAPDGAMAAGWQWINGAWYYLDGTTGAMRTGWLKDGASWYYLDPATGRLTP